MSRNQNNECTSFVKENIYIIAQIIYNTLVYDPVYIFLIEMKIITKLIKK
jgi:hypothetical protein